MENRPPLTLVFYEKAPFRQARRGGRSGCVSSSVHLASIRTRRGAGVGSVHAGVRPLGRCHLSRGFRGLERRSPSPAKGPRRSHPDGGSNSKLACWAHPFSGLRIRGFETRDQVAVHSCRGDTPRSLCVVQRLIDLARHPQVMQKHRQLAGHCHDCSFLGVLAPALGQSLTETT